MIRSNLRRSQMKSKPKKVPTQERKIRESARNERCTLRIETVCNGRTDTTVYCHSNLLADGKGMGLKANRGCYGCFDCHDVLDGRRPRPKHMSHEDLMRIFESACEETLAILKRKGIIDEKDDKD